MPKARHATLALGIAVAACKALFPGASVRVEGLTDLAEYAFSGNRRWRERNKFKRQIEDGIDALTDRLAALEEVEFQGLREAEKDQAAETVVTAISAARLQKEKLQTNLMLDSEKIFLELEPGCLEAWRSAYLSEDSIEYGRILLRMASEYLVSLIRNLPDFNDDVTWLNYVETRRLAQDFENSLKWRPTPSYSSLSLACIYQHIYDTSVKLTSRFRGRIRDIS